ncbi:ABC transporter C family member 3-like isoform X2 [Magnolia sinica]|uniref:ABC transporter C family member 3-like isoform X2 n=1 Tax=Magnolia sinica TaxID=86752 RepID=UPI00265AE84C|nr:ABC transporter C family member 3-like isoform X2 [Magnolia sinica]
MATFNARNDGMFMLFSHPSPYMHKAITFLQNPIFLHGFSASTHLAFILLLSMTWVIKGCNMGGDGHSKERLKDGSFLYYKPALFSSLGLSLFHLVLCILNYFVWYQYGWSDENLSTQLDLALRTLAWFMISAYLHFKFRSSEEEKFPIVLRIWWFFYFFMCCSFVVLDLVYYQKPGILPTHTWVLDFGSVLFGLFLCYAGLFGKKNREEEARLLEEPLLNGNSVGGSHKKSKKDNVTPYANASLFSLLTFSWMSPLLKVGYKKTLDIDDVPQLADDDSVNGVFPVFSNKLEEDSSNGVGTLKLLKALFFTVWKEVLWTALFVLLYTVSSYVGPYLINAFVQYLNGHSEFANEGYVLVSTFFIAKIIECLSEQCCYFKLRQAGIRGRAALVAMIYKKGLSLSSQSRQGHTSGEIINFMSVDAERVGYFSCCMHALWMVPVQVTLALLILYKNLGLASIAAFVATVVVMLMNVPLGKLQENYQGKLMKSKDVRMKAMSEILRNMRILKLQGWEMKFLSKIVELRKDETSWLKKYVYTSAMTTFVFWGAPTFVSVITFGACMLMGIPLESGKILSALATFRILQEPIYALPDTISTVVQTKVSLDRISSFLRLEDLQPDVVERLPEGSSDVAVEISDGNFSWDLSSANPTLKDLNFRALHGMRVAVCGTVGSGKSSLLSCILGEVPKISGTIKLCGTKAYVAQSPWIQSGKIEENILFGKEMDREKYEHVLEACSLKKDLEILSFGDQTVIGERGINLSGGQKQRIQIARALYQDADIYLFDDPFSAVDAHTGTHLFKASTDQSAVDTSIPFQIGSTAFAIIRLLGIIAVMSQVAWQVLIIFIPVIATCIWYQQYYIPTARELARLVGIFKAPNIQHFAETLSGLTTIRSFDQESRFMDTNLSLIDGYSRPKFHNAGAMEWLCFRLDMLSSISFAFCLVFLITMPKGVIDPGIAGLAVTYGLNLNMLTASVVWNLCNLENNIISVERIFQYMSISSEPPLVIETNRPDPNWPAEGEVDIHDLQVRYAPHMPLVLRGLTCTFPAGMKTGIVGRTGSGKSTLIQTLFRIIDPVAGKILIDGLDISTIGLHDLRSRLSIIPQDPTMFEGTVRSNLDPLEEYTDEQIWEALDRCQLGDEVRRKEGKLDSIVVENGENWSMGQRQLVCLGRVILKKSKVLVLDEATASVDTATDNLIQQTLRQQFFGCTVITIAHRITSVLDSDMVLLLDNGLIVEYDSPKKLLENKSSSFSRLVAEYTVRSNSSFENLANL